MKRPLTTAERQQKHRHKNQAIKLGTYEKPLVEKAREILREMEDPDLDKMLSKSPEMSHLTEEERSSLASFTKYLKKRKVNATSILSPTT